MITRIVKMEFEPSKIDTFLQIFERSKLLIRNSPGCLHLTLFCDKNNPATYFTYSQWVNEEALEQYRHSDLFITTWASTKVLFAGKAQAWTIEPASTTT